MHVMSSGCWFRECRWLFFGNVTRSLADGPGDIKVTAGLYQCARCKTLSLGSPDGPHNVPLASRRVCTCLRSPGVGVYQVDAGCPYHGRRRVRSD